MPGRAWIVASLCFFFGGLCGNAEAQQPVPTPKAPERIIIDTDIGDAIDDAFAIALALRSPELDILGLSTDYGDTEGRARILDRMLGEAGRQTIPVAVGAATALFPSDDSYASTHNLDQRRYGEGGHFARTSHPHAVEFILEQIRRFPGEITLVTIAPLPNIGALIDRSPETFRKLKRVVMMGGSIAPRKPEYGNAPPAEPIAEWNVMLDISAAQKLFRSGVPVYVMPLDSTENLKLDEVKRTVLFAHATPLTDALTLLYHQWNAAGGVTPTLYDAMTIAYILDPQLCPVQPMRIRVDDKGFTRVEDGTPNAQVCLHSDADAVLRFYMQRLLAP
jgi:inosine-uridine nucleoside N-ribohydrolase